VDEETVWVIAGEVVGDWERREEVGYAVVFWGAIVRGMYPTYSDVFVTGLVLIFGSMFFFCLHIRIPVVCLSGLGWMIGATALGRTGTVVCVLAEHGQRVRDRRLESLEGNSRFVQLL